jgi:hypothetical protein
MEQVIVLFDDDGELLPGGRATAPPPWPRWTIGTPHEQLATSSCASRHCRALLAVALEADAHGTSHGLTALPRW